MARRDRDQDHRVSTPLELFFDLCFVVAVSQAAGSLHHALVEGHIGHGIIGFASVFFAIWWAWMNFTWFASAYDVDDVPYRLLTLLTIVGVLVLAAGIPAMFENHFVIGTLGYALMRVALVAQWVRVARNDRLGRPVARRFAIGVAGVQLLWLARLALPAAIGREAFFVLVVLELAVPMWAERAGPSTSWHPAHVADRYGAFTIIVLGECVLAATNAVQASLTSGGATADLLVFSGASVVVVFGLWWTYFQESGEELLREQPERAYLWGYSHYLVFGAIAALGAGLALGADSVEHPIDLSSGAVALAIALPVAAYLLALGAYRSGTRTDAVGRRWYVIATAAVVVVAAPAVGPTSLPGSVAVMGGAVAALVATDIVLDQRAAATDVARPAEPAEVDLDRG